MKKNGTVKNCLKCGKSFYAKAVNIKKGWAKYCSHECYWNDMSNRFSGSNSIKYIPEAHIISNCLICNKEIKTNRTRVKDGRGKFCSRECYAESLRRRMQDKTKHPNWKGGITPKLLQYYNSNHWQDKKKVIFKKYDYTCQICGIRHRDKRGRPLQVHHIIPYRVSHNDDEENLILLCQRCHSKIEKSYRRAHIRMRFLDCVNNDLREMMLEYQKRIDNTMHYFLKGMLKPALYWDGYLDASLEVFSRLLKILRIEDGDKKY